MKNFFYKLLSDNDSISSKRLMALLAFISVIVMSFLKYDLSIIIALIGLITGLMGLSSFDKRNDNTNDAG
jgi:hypothetical protein